MSASSAMKDQPSCERKSRIAKLSRDRLSSVMNALTEADEIEFDSAIGLSIEQEAIVDLHSVINVINVLYGCLELLRTEGIQGLENAQARVYQLSQGIKCAAAEGKSIDLEVIFSKSLITEIEAAVKGGVSENQSPGIVELCETIATVFEIIDVRVEELQRRSENPDAWVRASSKHLSISIEQFLAGVEKNARGRYKIVRNIAEQTPIDYQVDLWINSTCGDEFIMPPVLLDIFRDLIANARKYTQAGGKISAGLHASMEGVRIVVEDNGVGIPREEMKKVVEFGYRASNILNTRTLGGGFGLTKALWMTKHFGGRMWLRSRVGVGTRITIFVPSQADKVAVDYPTCAWWKGQLQHVRGAAIG